MRPAPQSLHELLPIEVLLPVHAPILGSRSLQWADEAACAEFTAALSTQPALGQAFIALHGALGAGKTTFVRHLLRALGVAGRIKSPTFAVLESYELPAMQIAHFDFYRFESPREWLDAGFREHFEAPGLKLVEWPEKAAPLLPMADLDVFIETRADAVRQVTLHAHTPCGLALLD
jgi:tRNA threonylcarbamoyladenosine biosynthesis protein TsaE